MYHQGYTKLVKVIPSVALPPGALLAGRQPAVALVAGDELGDMREVKILSLKEDTPFHALRFHADIHVVACNRQHVVVQLKEQVSSLSVLNPLQSSLLLVVLNLILSLVRG